LLIGDCGVRIVDPPSHATPKATTPSLPKLPARVVLAWTAIPRSSHA